MNELLNDPSCVTTNQTTSCYRVSGSQHSNTDTMLFIGGFVVLIVVAIVVYRLKFGGK